MKHLSILIAMVACSMILATTIDLNNLFSYSNQNIPNYINKDNTNGNNITNAGATLGRVLFYDKNLSVDNTIACASCHQQEFAFGDTALVSQGVNGVTGRHSMRLVNARFGNEENFFWDERADDLEEQTTMPIQDHAEMGFSGQSGAPDLDDLIEKLEQIDYYNELFYLVYGDTEITEVRIQNAIAQFIRSIQSFDSKYDEGRAQVNNDNQPFPNFSNDENLGKTLFRAPPQFDANGSRIGGGLGCNGCHNAPEFDIDPNSNSNSVIGVIGSNEIDFTVTRAPTLRDLVNPQGIIQPMMHTGQATNLEELIDIYNEIILPGNGNNNRIDRRLRPAGNPQRLNITDDERTQLKAFLMTLTGSNVYTNPLWSNPFDENGDLTILNGSLNQVEAHSKDITVNLNSDGEAIVSAEMINDGSIGDNLSMEIDKTIFDCSDLGENTVRLFVNDDQGNSAYSESIVTVVDMVTPVVFTRDITVDITNKDSVEISASDIDKGSYDNCTFELSIDNSKFYQAGNYEVTLLAEDSSGNKTFSNAIVQVIDNTLSINESIGLKVYPNPSSDFIQIDYSGKIDEILVYDIYGTEVLSSKNSLLNVQGLASGKYFISVKSPSDVFYLDFVKR